MRILRFYPEHHNHLFLSFYEVRICNIITTLSSVYVQIWHIGLYSENVYFSM